MSQQSNPTVKLDTTTPAGVGIGAGGVNLGVGSGSSGMGAATVGSAYNTTAITKQKVITLAKKNPQLAAYLSSVYGLNTGQGPTQAAAASNNGVIASASQATSASAQGNVLDRYTKNILQTIFSAENALNGGAEGGGSGGIQGGLEGISNAASQTIGKATNSINSGINKLGNSITSGLAATKADLNKLLEPVSSFTGSTLGTLTNVLKDPLGSVFALPNTIMHMLDRINPGFATKLDATFKKLNVENLQNLPSQIVGGIRSMLSTVDKLLAIPFGIISDLYNGLMSIMQNVSKLIDSVISQIFNFFFGPGGLLDSLFPVAAILEVLQAIGQFASMFGQITQMVGGFAMVDNIVGQVQGYVSQASGILSNPSQLLMSYIPPQATQFLSGIRNPQQFLGQIVPPQVSGLLGQISQVSGLGFSSNPGYGLGQTLETLKSGVLTQVFDRYVSQIGILGPLLGRNVPGAVVNNQQSNVPTVQTSPIGGQPVVQGVPVDLTPRPKVLPDQTGQ